MKSFLLIVLWFSLHIAFLVWYVPQSGEWWSKTISGVVAYSAFICLYDFAAHVWYGGSRRLVLEANPFWSIPAINLVEYAESWFDHYQQT